MRYLFDSSALVNFIEHHGSQSASFIINQNTLDLAFYELGNANWKNVHRKLISLQAAKEIMHNIQNILQSMQVIPCDLETQTEILELAALTDSTFYDAAYLFIALKKQLILVTDDEKMHKIAKNQNIPVKKSDEVL